MILPDLSLKLCKFNYCLKYPYVILFIIPIFIILFFIIRKDYIKFRNKDEASEYNKTRRPLRIFFIITRSVIFLLLLIAIASPFTEKQKTTEGNPSLVILADNSNSFNMFDKSIALKLKENLDGTIPVSLKYIAEGDKSAIGDGILNNMQGDDNILIISDGNNNFGTDLGDMIMFASAINTSIHTLNIESVKKDVGITIDGPSEVILGAENNFNVIINRVGLDISCSIDVSVDNKPVLSSKKCETTNFKKAFFKEGYHKIVGTILPDKDDFFKKNNIFYKTVKVVQRPKVLFVSEKESPILDALNYIYDVTSSKSLPNSLNKYSAVIINDIKAESLNNRLTLLSDYVINGNGLFVIGGESSYDKGNYKDSLFETLLPVKVGLAEKKETEEHNVVLVIDLSGTTSFSFGSGSSNTVIDIEKSLALRIINDSKPEDKIGVVGFNVDAYLVSPLTSLSQKPDLADKIASLQVPPTKPGTFIYTGIQKAERMLEGQKGSKNIVLFSDGVDHNEGWTLDEANFAAKRGVKIYTVGVGRGTNVQFMKQLAQKGKGVYFEPTEAQHLKIIFSGEADESKGNLMNLVILDSNHFITTNLKLGATVSGFNQVVPKPVAKMLVATNEGNPVLSAWRFGLGRVISLSTDDGSKWAGKILSKDNSKLITRAMNWAIGDLSRNKDFVVKIRDTTLKALTSILVKSKKVPKAENLTFSKIGKNLYETSIIPDKKGFNEILGGIYAVNYKTEYEILGFNPELKDLVLVSGGTIFKPDDIDNIIETVKKLSKRVKIETVNFRWPFILAAIILFLVEITVRRLIENRNIFKS